ncbi:hypothetical protein J1N35_007673 [Gossypium stocksii]|uniref:Uncharacterized protein n=1 Tax=Gossypium stocksii TaxID=47602 RepID=A0A9D3W9M7_9ROSI|nr:hypothetical protein J1N35_007673 [Gossypium stocksii]
MTRDTHSNKGSDNPSQKTLVTMKNLTDFTTKLQQDLFKVNNTFENMIGKLMLEKGNKILYFKR